MVVRAKDRRECDVGRKAWTRMSLATRRFRIPPASAVSAVAAMLPKLSEAWLEGRFGNSNGKGGDIQSQKEGEARG